MKCITSFKIFLCVVFLVFLVQVVAAEQINIPGTVEGGVQYTAQQSGIYKFTYISGAVRGPECTEQTDCTCCAAGQSCWSGYVYIYVNRAIFRSIIDSCPVVPNAPDYFLGTQHFYTLGDAEAALAGTYVEIPLNKGDTVTLTIRDYAGLYGDNLGGMTINISPILTGTRQTETVGKSTSYPPTLISTPIITISPSVQIPQTNNGDSSYYFAVIIVLIIVLCVVGAFSLHMIREKQSVHVKYPDQKPLFRSTSSSTPTETTIKFRPSSFENESTHHDIFVSYSSEDKPIADAICNHLESRHIRCWVAPRDILPGMNYQEAIIDAIDSSSIMVLVFSSHSNESPHVLTEVNEAMSNGVIIIPFRIENILPSKAMKYLISGPHWLDAMTPPLEKHIQELEETVRILIERKQQKSK